MPLPLTERKFKNSSNITGEAIIKKIQQYREKERNNKNRREYY